MANDPNRDLLPVKDTDDRCRSRGINCRVDHNVIGKLKRSDLEDKYMRLYDENTQIKKQLNCQDEKIKRLGTKLLRLLGDKKNSTDNCAKTQDSKVLEELQMRIIELKHENFILKDRNWVLKQQLSSHARQHVAAHRSPNRSVHTSPRISQRQSSAPNVNESNYILSNINQPHDQLQEAEEHINGLNEEIKSLHNKIDNLQQDLEKSSLENQKTKVCENIELIRLQRSLKQQSIQIASLQVQIKNSEKCQQLLRDELATAHKENEESLQVISEKQKEILDLYTKLEEKNLSRLEQEEMRERINDLASERDSLRERGEFLMKTIEAKSSETEIVNDLKRLLALEKSKKEELKQSLENTQKVLQSLKESARLSQSSISDDASKGSPLSDDGTKAKKDHVSTAVQTVDSPRKTAVPSITQENELELLASTQLFTPQDERSNRSMSLKDYKLANSGGNGKAVKSVDTETENSKTCRCWEIQREDSATQTLNEDESLADRVSNAEIVDTSRVYEAEKMNLERELDYVKQMLRSQTQRCEAQEEEVNRLKSELRISEEKYNDTLKRLDLHLKIFRHLESRTARSSKENDPDAFEQKYLPLLRAFEEGSLTGPGESVKPKRAADEDEQPAITSPGLKSKSRSNSASKSDHDPHDLGKIDSSQFEKDGRLKFVERKFLDSSDDEEDGSDEIEKEKEPSASSHSQAAAKMESSRRSSVSTKSSRKSDGLEYSQHRVPPSPSVKHNEGDSRPVPKPRREFSKMIEETASPGGSDIRSPVTRKSPKLGANISISVEWLKLEPQTSVWYNDNIKLLFVDFSFLDVKGEETETPSSLKKPKKPLEKCHYNFTREITTVSLERVTKEKFEVERGRDCIEMTEYRLSALQAMRNNPDWEIIVFKVVSEPEESNDEGECVDIGVAAVSAKQFFDSNPNNSILLHVKNVLDQTEVIGILSVRLDISSIA